MPNNQETAINIKPLGSRVIIKVDEIPMEYITESIIVVPDHGNIRKMATQTGVVVAVGDGCSSSLIEN